MDPDQTALSLHCLLERLLKHFSRRQKQSNFIVIGALRVNVKNKQLNIDIYIQHLEEPLVRSLVRPQH